MIRTRTRAENSDSKVTNRPQRENKTKITKNTSNSDRIYSKFTPVTTHEFQQLLNFKY